MLYNYVTVISYNCKLFMRLAILPIKNTFTVVIYITAYHYGIKCYCSHLGYDSILANFPTAISCNCKFFVA